MPELKRPLDPSDSTALVVAKRPRNELVEVKDKSKAVVASVSIKSQPLMGWCFYTFLTFSILQLHMEYIQMIILGTSSYIQYGSSNYADVWTSRRDLHSQISSRG